MSDQQGERTPALDLLLAIAERFAPIHALALKPDASGRVTFEGGRLEPEDLELLRRYVELLARQRR